MTPSEQLALYRSDHRIAPLDGRCQADGIRVLPVKGGRWRHDPDQIVALIDQEYGHIWPSQADRIDKAAVEVARDIIREDLYPLASESARDDGAEQHMTGREGWDDPEDDEWTNREGMPEFNGSFR